MGKTSKWLRNFLAGKKDKDKEKQKCPSNQNPVFSTENTYSPISQTTPKEKKRWSFRRSSVSKDTNSAEHHVVAPPIVQVSLDAEINEQKKHAMAVAAATADAAVAAVQAAAAVIRLTSAASGKEIAIEEAAAIKIQSYFRSYLARKALCALKGLVKLQALVRGHLVRKQAAATLRCMQALVTAQARALAQRIHMTEDPNLVHHRPSTQRKSIHDIDNRLRNTYHEFDRGLEENIKIVEMDLGESNKCIKSRNSYSNHQQTDYKFSKHDYAANSGQDDYHVSPAPSALTEMSPRAYSGHFEDCSFTTAQSSPQYCSAISKPDPTRVPFAFARPDYAESLCYDYPLYPSYMANTESSRAKARSQSAPKSRPPDSFERQPSRRRVSTEGRNVPRSVKMQRSSSHVGSAAQNYQYPWSMKLDRSTVSLKESECGSTSTVLTNTNYCRSLMAYDAYGSRY